MQNIEVPLLCDEPDLVPLYASDLAAGADLKANIPETVILQPGEAKLIPTGLRFEIPAGYEIQVRPRSGLALKHGVTVLNTPGTIDADYRGEVGVILINHSNKAFAIEPRMRIAQLVLAEVVQASFIRREELSTTRRGEGGFGHTGTN